ncbi:dispase autolysis-inducing protein [Nonomuraea phyllanthi]|uniref:Dispase autolysis-inducing protein n=1 Tax=Nonomuraea phyllanthi TaxID=2219224 RepID=A0A5C4VJ16_9ACTN|nr:dispase autolysis-inducing protein [Nonomuraea phyllanthi]KAB8189162.1 dispase autolysis-inducing protein [Nonomuraea phyllanthi]
MKKMITLGITAALVALSSTAPAVADDDPAAGVDGRGGRHQPRCETVTGDGSVTFTRDEGKTIMATSQALKPVVYTTGLVALDRPGRLLAMSNNTLLTSKDAGCTWTRVGEVNGWYIRLTAARGGRAYAWDNQGAISLVTPGGVTPLTSPASEVAGLGADPLHRDRLRVMDGDGQLRESRDGGRTWEPVGTPAFQGGEPQRIYTAVFHPDDLDHVVLGTVWAGIRVTYDGGRTWTRSTGLGEPGAKVNVFSATISPAAPNVVYAMGINLKESHEQVPSDGRHIYRSLDGGATFAPIVDQTSAITLPNGPEMAAHPEDPGVLYFVWGTGWQGIGTDVYRYDARTGQVTTTHNAYDRVTSMAFNPTDPRVMYLGVAEEV